MVTEKDEIISELYDLVSSPDQYDAFMLKLEKKLQALTPEGDAAATGQVMSHMKRAAALVDIVTPWRRDTDDVLHKELAQRMQATMALDETGAVVDANTAAKVAYELVPDSGLDRLPIDEEQLADLHSQVRMLVRNPGGRNAPNDVLRYHNDQTGRPLLIRLEPYVQPSTDRRFVILRTSDVGWPAHLGPILQDLFNLTRAELEVTRMVVEGDKVKEIARRRQSSATTVRSQLQAIFAKTDTADQMDLVRTVFGLALMHDVEEGKLVAARINATSATEFFPREDQRHLFALPDGRQMEYSDFGVAGSKKVILFYHDQAFGDVWFKEAVQSARRRGLRIIGPLRPGFGQTTVYPGEASEPRDFAPDVMKLLDHLDIRQVAILALSSGLVHSLAAAELMPHRITSITACHPLLPVTCDEDLEGTNGYNYLIPHSRLHFPQSLKFLCKAGFAFVMRSGPAAFGKAVMRASPRDVEWLMRPEILPVMVHGRRVHQDQGYVGNFGDLNYRKDWRPLLRNCPVPVLLVIGEHDRNVQWGAARRWSEMLDQVDLHVLPDSGYMVHHQQYETVLNWMSEELKPA